jgi:hypothetical protein
MRWFSLLATAFLICGNVAGQVNVLTYHNNNSRTGENLNETLLTPANTGSNTFGKLFTYSVDGYVYAQPLYVSGLTIPGLGARNVLFVATQHNTVYAFDADSNSGPGGGLLWQVNLGQSAATPTTDFGTRYGAYMDVQPEVGITSTPVIDPVSGAIYVDAFTPEGATYVHRLHALNITNGQERPFSPELVAAAVPGIGVQSSNGVVVFDGRTQIQRCALTLVNGRLYAAYGGYADTNPYHGWVIGFDPVTLQVLTNYVWNATPNSTVAAYGPDAGEGGIWMGGCGLSADAAGSIYLIAGNGSFNALNDSGGTEYGNTFIRMTTSSGLGVADYFTPYNQAYLSQHNLDVDSGGLMLLPDQPGPYPHLMTAGGKDGTVYWINRDMMTAGNNHYNDGGTTNAVLQTLRLGGGVSSTPAYFNGRIYWAAVGDVLVAFLINNGLMTTFTSGPRTFPYPGATPCISANGTNNGIVWTVQRSNPAVLVANDAANLPNEIYNSSQVAGRDQLTNGVKFAVPTIANGKVYVGAQYAVSVFGLLGGPRAVWRMAHFGSTTNASVSGDLADPDGDGMPNIFEYAMATDPNQADLTKPFGGRVATNSFEMRLRRNLSATDVAFSVQSSATVRGPWTNVASYSAATGWTTNAIGFSVVESGASGAPPDQFVNVTVSAGIQPVPGSAFYRLRLSF